MPFEKFKPIKDFNYDKGWNRFALDYAQLPQNNPIYALTKEVLYDIIRKNHDLYPVSHVLDLGCGSGNDFSFFLQAGAHITAVDMSDGMLNKAWESYKEDIENGRVELLRGRLENINESSFNGRKYDLIFSVTGGFAYMDDAEMLRIFRLLKKMLNPGGKIISGHFNRHCFFESVYYLCGLHFKQALQRKNNPIRVSIKEETMTMYLRSVKNLRKLFAGEFNPVRFYPLMAFTPPYQTAYHPPKQLFNIHKFLEKRFLSYSAFALFSDQVIMVLTDV